ncbi:AAA family ATPase [Pseudomonas sp. NPDC089406]|uniref:AAA family ATPase n=1 Tax=Pseudomonas sp. NPDC089406 TaxID=3364463 RepID=UPI00384D276A
MGIQAIWSSKLDNFNAGPNGIRSERLNLFIGPNNSGKSRLLRALFSSEKKELQVAAGRTLSTIAAELGDMLGFFENHTAIGPIVSADFLGALNNKCLSHSSSEELFNNLLRVIDGRTSIYENHHISHDARSAMQSFKWQMEDRGLSDTAPLTVGKLKSTLEFILNSKHHYIPILRGMRPLDASTDAFRNRTCKDYFPAQALDIKELNIITGFDLYQLLVQFLLGQPQERQLIREYETILGHEFFGGAEITLIPQYGKDTVSVKIGDDDQFSIFDLGDGMQQVIIITSAAFLTKEPARFFIEEPELCLHPGLLRKLALFLLNHTEHQYFATTHSNHLLDLAEIDTRVTIHKVSKIGSQADVKFEVKESTKDRELLAELGVSASSVYLANCTVWVEGITDRLYLGVFMKQYIDELEEGTRKTKLTGLLENFHYAFVEYQGGTLGHWAFDDRTDTEQLNATRLCATAFLLADGDIVGKGDRADLLQQQLGMRLHLLKGKEIENLLPRNIIIETAKTLFGRKNKATVQGLDPALLDKLEPGLEVSPHGIGRHLDNALGLNDTGKDARRVFAEDSGTIKDKVKFCHAAIEQMKTLEWKLTEPLRGLCEQIFEHILSNNHL